MKLAKRTLCSRAFILPEDLNCIGPESIRRFGALAVWLALMESGVSPVDASNVVGEPRSTLHRWRMEFERSSDLSALSDKVTIKQAQKWAAKPKSPSR